MPARLTERWLGVTRGLGVLLGRRRRDSLRTAERYGRLSSVKGEGIETCLESLETVGVIDGLSESSSERRRS